MNTGFAARATTAKRFRNIIIFIQQVHNRQKHVQHRKVRELLFRPSNKIRIKSVYFGIMVNSRQLHYGFSAEHKECEFICVLFSPELLCGNEWFYQNYIEPVTENSLYPYLYLGGEAAAAALQYKSWEFRADIF